MSFIEIFALSVALAMDAFAVATATGCTIRTLQYGHYLRMAWAFGFFQFFMPVVGWYMGLSVRSWIENWDHWIAFVLLAWIGGNMIRESFSEEEEKQETDPTRGRTLLLLAVATSIDALAVGLSFAVLNISVWQPSMVIGVVCAVITALGLYLGNRLARASNLSRYAELLGGIVLVSIGLKILYEHGVFG